MEDTREEVVNNLEPGLKTLVNLILVVKALLSYPLPYYAACELLEKELFLVSRLNLSGPLFIVCEELL